MRVISSESLTEITTELFLRANCELGEDVLAALRKAYQEETSAASRHVLAAILENARIAATERIPLCQDCGTAVVFLEIGQDVHITGTSLADAINEGVRRAYRGGFLRKSIVVSPFSARRNTGDNTPAVIHSEIVPGEHIRISVLPKGGGAENMSRLGTLLPSAGKEGIISFVVRAVDEAGSNPCPPLILGVGIGGTAEKAMLMAKHALLRRVGEPSPEAENAALEQELRERINALGIGAMGYGGRITALAVHVESFPTHIASLPVAVNFQCHAARHREAVL